MATGPYTLYTWAAITDLSLGNVTGQAETSEDGMSWSPIGSSIALTQGGTMIGAATATFTSTGSTRIRGTFTTDGPAAAVGISVVGAQCQET